MDNSILPRETLVLPASGKEIYGNLILKEGYPYEFICQGVIRWWDQANLGCWARWVRSDAAYWTYENDGNYINRLDPSQRNNPYITLFGEGALDPKILSAKGDRATHTYRMLLRATKTQRLALRITNSISRWVYGNLTVTVYQRTDIYNEELAEAEEQRSLAAAEIRRSEEKKRQQERHEEAARERQRQQEAARQRQEEAEKAKKLREEQARKAHEKAAIEKATAEARAQEAAAKSREAEANRERALAEVRAKELSAIEEAERAEKALAVQQTNEKRRRLEISNGRLARIRNTVLRYMHFPHYQDPVWIENYARFHLHDLLQERDRIISATLTAHSDKIYIDLLKKHHPETYERAIWESKALARAEQLEVEPKNKRRKFTIEEYRARKRDWLNVQAADAQDLQRVRLELIQKHRSFLDEFELTDEERRECEEEFFDSLFKATSEKTRKSGGQDYEIVS